MTPEKQSFVDAGIKQLKKDGDYSPELHDVYVDHFDKLYELKNESRPEEDNFEQEPSVKAIEGQAENAESLTEQDLRKGIEQIDTALSGGDTSVGKKGSAPKAKRGKVKSEYKQAEEKAQTLETYTPYHQALQYFIGGGKVTSECNQILIWRWWQKDKKGVGCKDFIAFKEGWSDHRPDFPLPVGEPTGTRSA